MSGKEASNDCETKVVTMKTETEETYEKTQGGAGAHGHFMEIHLLALFKVQGDKNLKEFYLAGNFRRAGVFDDIVFCYADANDRQNVIFLKAKSKAIDNYKVGLDVFEKGKMFDLQKHFNAFLTIQDEWNKPANVGLIFQGNPKSHFVMYTNAILDDSMIEHVDEIDTNPLSIVLGQTIGHTCNLTVETANMLFREIQNSNEIKTVMIFLKKILITDCKNLHRDQIFNKYCAFLTHTVFATNCSIWKFRNEFLEGGYENSTVSKFREETIMWYAEAKLGNEKGLHTEMRNDEILAHMRKWEVQLPDWMENKIPKFDTALCDKFIETASQCISGNICTVTNMSKGLLNNVAKLAGNVFVFDEKIAMFKFNKQKISGESENS